MGSLRTTVETASAEFVAEHPRYFTPHGRKHAANTLTRKIMSAMRNEIAPEKTATPTSNPSDATEKPQGMRCVAANSREGRGYLLLRRLAGAVTPMLANSGYLIAPEADCAAVYALADAPREAEWSLVSDRQQIAAWLEFFDKKLPGVARRVLLDRDDLHQSLRLPWPWPPRVDGAVDPPLIDEFA